MPYPADSSKAGADLALLPDSVRGEPQRTGHVGVGGGCHLSVGTLSAPLGNVRSMLRGRGQLAEAGSNPEDLGDG